MPARFSIRLALLSLCTITAPAAAQGFGSSVVGDANTILVGEPQAEGTPGRVYVFAREGEGKWTERGRLAPTGGQEGDRFGAAMSVDGDRLLVGAPAADSGRGAAYLFERRGGSWVQAARLDVSDRAGGDQSGASVALSGNTAVVGAPGRGEGAGVVHVFRRDAGGRWTQAASITPDSAAKGQFGRVVALDGTTLLVGAPQLAEFTGAAFAFRLDPATGSATPAGRLSSRLAVRSSGFGSALAVKGRTAMVGAPRTNTFAGAVAILELDSASGQWRDKTQLLPFDGGRGQFGAAVAFDERSALVFAPTAEQFQGRVYTVTRDAKSGEWLSAGKLGVEEGGQGGGGRGSIALAGGRAIVGRPGADYGLGAALVLQRDQSGAWRDAGRLVGDELAYDAMSGSERRCQGGKVGPFACADVDVLSFTPLKQLMGARGVELSGVWGWTDPSTGKEYALVGRSDGTTFVDVSNPGRPVVLGNLPKTEGSPGSSWREIKTYKNYAFVVSDGAGSHGMQVFDLTRLRSVRGQPRTFAPDARYTGVHSVHNIVINEETGFAFATGSNAGGETCGGGLHMIDIREPKNPKFAGCFNDPQTGRAGTGYTHDAQCVTYRGPDADYRGREICVNANETAISIADVTDKANPKALSRATYPNVGYAHQGWFTEDQRYWFMDDELDEMSGSVTSTRTLIWDLNDLDDPVLLKEWLGTTRATDHNLYITGSTMYQSNYVAGLRVVDISDVRNPKEIGYFDTVPTGKNEPGFAGTWSNYPFFRSGTLVVPSGREGLFLLKKREAPVP
ncbi:MAG: choice-of-anchor B family protein [Gemmatimonadales bacterium]